MNKYFLEPEIKVTKFDVCDVITTSGYGDNNTNTSIDDSIFGQSANNKVIGGLDGDIPL